jgi:hypothetical protein
MYTALQWIALRIRWALPASLALAACIDSATSAADLHPEGPPMIEQVRLTEVYTADDIPGLQRTVFAFGSHADALPSEQHPVTTAAATGNRLRIIMDELLRGNNLEEIQCRGLIDDDAFGPVPVGDTPDDIARCAVAQDVLPSRCPGSSSRSVCICALDAGCMVDRIPGVTPRGESVGIKDADGDGATDATQFIAGAVGIRCGAIDVPTNRALSYWTPSGTQQTPAQGGFDVLGPAIVLVPAAPLPTGADCSLVFASSVVDKDGNQVCAPPDGDISAGCTPGDSAAFHFTVEPMGFIPTPAIKDPGQSRTGAVLLRAPAALDATTIASITVTEGATPFTAFTLSVGTLDAANQLTIAWNPPGLAASTRYTITIPTTVTDTYHLGPPRAIQFAFTTAAN